MLSGCAAALIPLAAATVMTKTTIDRIEARENMLAAGAVQPRGRVALEMAGAPDTGYAGTPQTMGAPVDMPPGQSALPLPKASPVEEEQSAVLPPPVQSQERVAPPGRIGDGGKGLDATDQAYLESVFARMDAGRGSAFRDFADFAMQQSNRLLAGQGVDSVVLSKPVRIENPKTVRCEGKPSGVIIDIDAGATADVPDGKRFVASPDLVAGLRRLRAAEIAVIWLSDARVDDAEKISDLLAQAGLSETVSDDFLFLSRGASDRKQLRRWDAAENYCILAVAGEDRTDFDELYAYLRDEGGAPKLEPMFGRGWFVIPRPVIDLSRAGER